MASKEEGSQPLNYKTCVLKVSIHCEGCKKKVKKILKNINGVHSVDIDALQNKVTIAGDVDTETLIRRLAKSGKNADTWPEKKPANPNPNPNPSPNPSTNPKEKNKEKESKPAAKEVVATAADKTPVATSSEPAAKPAETATKPAETAAKPAEASAEPAKKEAAESSSKEEAAKPDKKPEKEPADTKSDTDTKPAETSAKPGGSGKKKGKKQEEATPPPQAAAAWEGHSGNSPRNRALPMYQVPVYAVSHNTAQPMASHSYYYAPTPAMPQSYAAHSAYNYSQPQPPSQQPEYYPSGNYSYNGSDNYYGSSQHSYSYYGSSSTELRASPSRSYPSQGQGQGGLDMFNDENAHSCSVM